MPGVLESWGMRVPGEEVRTERLLTQSSQAVLSRGLGRSYGDASFPAPGRRALATSLADRMLGFDPETGVLRAESGLSLEALNRIFLPRGFFSPVTPGTQFVTLGGMVAADVHGKNHHRSGCFGEHVQSLLLQVADGRIIRCSRTEEPELFAATLGGMGLTGHILEAEVRLEKIPSPWITFESERVADIDAYVDALKQSAEEWPLTVGWIDCVSRGSALGRGILIKGRWADPQEAPPLPPRPKGRLTVPFSLPGFAINRWTVRAFNALYFWKHYPLKRRGIMHPESFFYPLDALLRWNRLYGSRGMTQYQCVLPEAAGSSSARRFLEILTRTGAASPLCVIKDCGEEGSGTLSFPKRGISIAVDMAVKSDTQQVVDALNAFVIAEGGRIYLAKDGFTRPAHFHQMEPRLPAFLAVRRKWDPEGKLKSAQSIRLYGDAP